MCQTIFNLHKKNKVWSQTSSKFNKKLFTSKFDAVRLNLYLKITNLNPKFTNIYSTSNFDTIR